MVESSVARPKVDDAPEARSELGKKENNLVIDFARIHVQDMADPRKAFASPTSRVMPTLLVRVEVSKGLNCVTWQKLSTPSMLKRDVKRTAGGARSLSYEWKP